MFDDRLKNLRKAKGVTQGEVAVALGIGESAYGNYEKDIREPNAIVLKAMSRYFGVTIDYLLDCHTGFVASESEREQIQKYRELDDFGKETVSAVLDIEYRRCTADVKPQQATTITMRSAARSDDGSTPTGTIELTEEQLNKLKSAPRIKDL